MNNWNSNITKQWLTENGFVDFGVILCDQHKVDGSVLLSMTEEDLLLPLLNLRVFGDVRRLSMLLDNVRRENGTASQQLSRRHHPYNQDGSKELEKSPSLDS